MSLRVLNNEPAWDTHQDETKSFSKICFIPSLGLSCFGCCGHHFGSKDAIHKFMAKNKRTLNRFLSSDKTHKEFMEREKLLDACGGCHSLIREKQPEGHTAYVCAVHPLRIGGEDVRVGYCDHDYLCKTAGHVNKMTDEEKTLFYDFLAEQQFDSYTYSIINSQETVLLKQYRDWKEKRNNH